METDVWMKGVTWQIHILAHQKDELQISQLALDLICPGEKKGKYIANAFKVDIRQIFYDGRNQEERKR